MDRVLADDLNQHIDSDVVLYGWIYNVRALGSRTFLILRDRTGTAQVLLDKDIYEGIKDLANESVVKITGRVRSEERAPSGVEVVATNIEALVPVTEEMPVVISKKEVHANLDTLLDHRVVTLRHPRERAIFKIQDAILKLFDEYVRENAFTEIKVPETTGVATEGGTEVFEIKYFNKKAYLVQSPQLYKQIMVGVFERVFTVTRVFRAELHNTSRHMNESTQLDIEMGFVKDHYDSLVVAQEFFRGLSNYLTENFSDELKLFGVNPPAIPKEIPSLRFNEVREILAREFKSSLEGDDLSPEDERNIGQYVAEKLGSDFVFITHYPSATKPFYIFDDPDEPGVSRGFDIIFRGVEISSGGQRVHQYDELLAKMKKRKMNINNFEQYLEAFKFGLPPHAGWSIGLERLTMQLLGLKNIREASLFPRDLNRLEP